MPHSQTDITCDPAWIDAHAERLEAFEYLRKAVKADPTEIKPAHLADKLGKDKSFIHHMLNRIKERL